MLLMWGGSWYYGLQIGQVWLLEHDFYCTPQSTDYLLPCTLTGSDASSITLVLYACRCMENDPCHVNDGSPADGLALDCINPVSHSQSYIHLVANYPCTQTHQSFPALIC